MDNDREIAFPRIFAESLDDPYAPLPPLPMLPARQPRHPRAPRSAAPRPHRARHHHRDPRPARGGQELAGAGDGAGPSRRATGCSGWEGRQAPVVHVDAAMAEAALGARLRALGPAPPGLALIGDKPLDLGTTEDQARFIDELPEDGVLVLDGLSLLVPPGRRGAERWRRFCDWLRMLRQDGQAVVLVDHTSRPQVEALADTLITVKPVRDGARDRLRGGDRQPARAAGRRPRLRGAARSGGRDGAVDAGRGGGRRRSGPAGGRRRGAAGRHGARHRRPARPCHRHGLAPAQAGEGAGPDAAAKRVKQVKQVKRRPGQGRRDGAGGARRQTR